MSKNETFEKSIDALIDKYFLETPENREESEAEDTVDDESSEDIEKSESANTESSKTSATNSETATMETTGSTSEITNSAESVKKSAKEPPMKSGASKTEADEGEQAKKSKKDKEDKKDGRPKQVSDVPDVDKDGNRAKGYDAIQYPQSQIPSVNAKGTAVKSGTIEISKEDYDLLIKAKEEQKQENLKKAKEDQEVLVKAAVEEATGELKKDLKEALDLVKSLSKKPQNRKSISNIQAVEKGFGSNSSEGKTEYFSKSEMLDAAEKLVKSGDFAADDVIELEMTGRMYDSEKRGRLERELKRND